MQQECMTNLMCQLINFKFTRAFEENPKIKHYGTFTDPNSGFLALCKNKQTNQAQIVFVFAYTTTSFITARNFFLTLIYTGEMESRLVFMPNHV